MLLRYSAWFAAILMLVASARMISTYRALSHVTDEPAHLAAGIEWIENGTYTYEDQHPPLARVVGAAGAHFAGARWGRVKALYFEGFHLLKSNWRYTRNLYYARLAMLPFFWIGGLVVYLWARRLAGPEAALLSVFLYCTTPVILGHGALATTDMALTAFTAAAALAGVWWSEKPGWMRSIVFGIILGLAVLSKFSALVFLPAVWILFCARRLDRSAITKCAAFVPVSLATAALLVWAGYRFSIGPVDYLHATLPAPEFFTGLQTVWRHNSFGHLSYMLGEVRLQGFWYYYPVDLAIKTPIATLLLLGIGLASPRRVAQPLLFSAAILGVSLFSNINIGIRHILPVYIGFAICGGMVAWQLFQRPGRWIKAVVVALLLWQPGETAKIHPEYIAYTNEIAGSHPERFVVDSDLDWEQDWKKLRERLGELKANSVTLRTESVGYLMSGNEFPFIRGMKQGDVQQPGWTAVSLTALKITKWPTWAETTTPTERVGKSYLLFYLPE